MLAVHLRSYSSTKINVFSTGSKEERQAYEKAGGRVTEPNSGNTEVDSGVNAEASKLEVNIKHARPVFGTDFDVIIEVRMQSCSK